MTRLALYAFAIAFWLLILPNVLSATIPASLWLDVRPPFVDDSVEGVPPHITPDREIVRDFTGSWVAYVRRAEGEGFTHWCRRASPEPFRYIAGTQLTEQKDMDWWLEIPPNEPCEWAPGQYRVTTEWTIHLWGGVKVRTERTSNTFTIREAAP